MGVLHISVIVGCIISHKVAHKGLPRGLISPDDDPRIKTAVEENGIDLAMYYASDDYVVGLKKNSIEMDALESYISDGKKMPNMSDVMAQTKDALQKLGWWNPKTFGIWVIGALA